MSPLGQGGRELPHVRAGESSGETSRAVQSHHSHPVVGRKLLNGADGEGVLKNVQVFLFNYGSSKKEERAPVSSPPDTEEAAKLVTHSKVWRHLSRHNIASPDSKCPWTDTSRHVRMVTVVRNWKQETLRRRICHPGGIQELSEHVGNSALPLRIHQGKHRRDVCRGMMQDTQGPSLQLTAINHQQGFCKRRRKGHKQWNYVHFPDV